MRSQLGALESTVQSTGNRLSDMESRARSGEQGVLELRERAAALSSRLGLVESGAVSGPSSNVTDGLTNKVYLYMSVCMYESVMYEDVFECIYILYII